MIETDAAHRMVQRLAEQHGNDETTAREGLMKSLGAIPIGRPVHHVGRFPQLAHPWNRVKGASKTLPLFSAFSN
jgi:hypothetical protein